MAFPFIFSLFKCYRILSSLFMDQINIQSQSQVVSELFRNVCFDLRQVFRKLMRSGTHQFPTLRRVGTRYLWTRQVQKSITDSMSSIGIPEQRLQNILDRIKEFFQNDLYPWQISAIKNVLAGQRDTIVIAGTGSGKSLVFQSLQFATPDAIILVVSPLVALMENQVNVPLV